MGAPFASTHSPLRPQKQKDPGLAGLAGEVAVVPAASPHRRRPPGSRRGGCPREGGVPAGVSCSRPGVSDLRRSPAFPGLPEKASMFPVAPAPSTLISGSARKLTSSFLSLPSSDFLHFEVFFILSKWNLK